MKRSRFALMAFMGAYATLMSAAGFPAASCSSAADVSARRSLPLALGSTAALTISPGRGPQTPHQPGRLDDPAAHKAAQTAEQPARTSCGFLCQRYDEDSTDSEGFDVFQRRSFIAPRVAGPAPADMVDQDAAPVPPELDESVRDSTDASAQPLDAASAAPLLGGCDEMNWEDDGLGWNDEADLGARPASSDKAPAPAELDADLADRDDQCAPNCWSDPAESAPSQAFDDHFWPPCQETPDGDSHAGDWYGDWESDYDDSDAHTEPAAPDRLASNLADLLRDPRHSLGIEEALRLNADNDGLADWPIEAPSADDLVAAAATAQPYGNPTLGNLECPCDQCNHDRLTEAASDAGAGNDEVARQPWAGADDAMDFGCHPPQYRGPVCPEDEYGGNGCDDYMAPLRNLASPVPGAEMPATEDLAATWEELNGPIARNYSEDTASSTLRSAAARLAEEIRATLDAVARWASGAVDSGDGTKGTGEESAETAIDAGEAASGPGLNDAPQPANDTPPGPGFWYEGDIGL
jgi:hypothetical protein